MLHFKPLPPIFKNTLLKSIRRLFKQRNPRQKGGSPPGSGMDGGGLWGAPTEAASTVMLVLFRIKQNFQREKRETEGCSSLRAGLWAPSSRKAPSPTCLQSEHSRWQYDEECAWEQQCIPLCCALRPTPSLSRGQVTLPPLPRHGLGSVMPQDFASQHWTCSPVGWNH